MRIFHLGGRAQRRSARRQPDSFAPRVVSRCPVSTALAARRWRQPAPNCCYPLVNLAVMWFLERLLQPDDVHSADLHGRSLFSRRKARRGGARRLSGPALVDRQPRQGAGHPGVLLRPSADLGMGRLAGEKVRKYVDQVLCSLPFEPAWYHARGVSDAVYVGSSLLRRAERSASGRGLSGGQSERAGSLVAILPGSRTQEVTRNLPDMVRAAAKLAQKRPGVRFAVACLHERHKTLAEEIIAQTIAREGTHVRSWRSRSTPRALPS